VVKTNREVFNLAQLPRIFKIFVVGFICALPHYFSATGRIEKLQKIGLKALSNQ